MWEGAHAYLTNPAHMYDAAAAYLARSHLIAPPGTLAAFVTPPPAAALGLPIALLPRSVGVQVWASIDVAALVAILVLLYLEWLPRHRLAATILLLCAQRF